MGALSTLGVDEPIHGTTYGNWYQSLNYEYPFLDYTTGRARLQDAELMAKYALSSPAPHVSSPWLGQRQDLPTGTLVAQRGRPQTASRALLAGWLRVAAGYTGFEQLPHSKVGFKSSPSGGSRHPTDLAVTPIGDWADSALEDVGWWYDGFEHKLVRSESPTITGVSANAACAVFTVASHVRRAMWRYRDIRALRPVLIDAGHVIETLCLAIQFSGWTASWAPAPGFTEETGDLDPIFGYVIAHQGVAPILDEQCSSFELGPKPDQGSVLRTNPLISIVPTQQGLYLENHAIPRVSIPATFEMADALAYGIPSSRNDRPSSQLRDKLPPEQLAALIENRFFLDAKRGDEIWKSMRPWSDHDWFLSLLMHSEQCSREIGASSPIGDVAPIALNFPEAIRKRRTSRALSPRPLARPLADRLRQTLAASSSAVRIVATSEVGDITGRPGCFRWTGAGFEDLKADPPTQQQIAAAAIGQPWAQGFSTAFWLVPNSPIERWERGLIDCGRLAQALALAILQSDLVGVFQSPALIDGQLHGILGAEAALDGAYLVGIGERKSNPCAEISTAFFDLATLFQAQKVEHV